MVDDFSPRFEETALMARLRLGGGRYLCWEVKVEVVVVVVVVKVKEARGKLNEWFESATWTKRVMVIPAVDTSISNLDRKTAMQCDQRSGGVCRMIKGGHQIPLKLQCSGPWH